MTTTTSELKNEATWGLSTRGRPSKVLDDRGIKASKRIRGWQAYKRLCNLAGNKEFRLKHPSLAVQIDTWLYEVHYGKPALPIDQRISGRIVLTADDLVLIAPEHFNDTKVIEAEAPMLRLASGQSDIVEAVTVAEAEAEAYTPPELETE